MADAGHVPSRAASRLSEELLRVALDVAAAAGRLLRAGRAAADAAPAGTLRATALTKTSTTDLVTAVDRASERLVAEMLARERPRDAVLGEEGIASRDGSSGVRWVVDPLDGTTNFVYGFPAYAVSLAAELDGTTLVGVVHDASRGETYAALAGRGATLDGRPLRVGSAPPLSEALVGTGFSYSPAERERQARLLRVLLPAVRDLRRAGAAALDLCAVAAGRLDAFYESGLKPWDVAAGSLVASEAGAVLLRLDDILPGRPVLLAATPALAGPLADLLREAAADGSAPPDAPRAAGRQGTDVSRS